MTPILWLILGVGILGLTAGASALVFNYNQRKLLQKLFRETGHEEFGEVLLAHQRQLRRDQETFRLVADRLKVLEKESNFLLNQIGLVRYNPFSDSGGNMSFSLALLNNHGDGAVLTSLHSREGIRVYSKAVKNYKSEQSLTDEEVQAIDLATKIK